jgi:hypothetical protein
MTGKSVRIRATLTPAQYGALLVALGEYENRMAKGPFPGSENQFQVVRRVTTKIIEGSK